MKKCPSCQQVFSDDDMFCADDGATLVPYVDNAAGGYVSRDAPTQVIQQPLPQPAVNENKTKWLYLLIGVLVTALLGLGVIIFITGSKEEKTETISAGSKTDYKTVTPESSAPVKTPAPVNAAPPAASVPVATARVSPGGSWSGDWTSPSGAYLTINVNLVDDGAGNVQGQIEWTLRSTKRPDKVNKIGMTAVEYVRGKFDPATRNLAMSGYRKEDPNNVLVMVDDYRLALAADDRNLNGAARNGGKWDGKMRLQRN